MRFALVFPGKIKDAFAREGIDHYRKLLSARAALDLVAVKDERADPARRDAVLAAEGARLLKALEPYDRAVALDERGKPLDSAGLSRWIAAQKCAGASRIAFVAGSAFGLSPAVTARCELALSLSALTLPHQLALLVAAEQIFRAAKIEHGESYHY